jgi:hypothetical protein
MGNVRIALLLLASGLAHLVFADPEYASESRPIGQKPYINDVIDDGHNLDKMRASLLKKGVIASQAQAAKSTNNVRFLLGRSLDFDRKSGDAAITTTAQALLVPAGNDTIPQSYWSNANKIIAQAGLSTPIPPANVINPNAPGTPPPPLPWQSVMDDPGQPMDAKLGGAIMYGLSSKPTATPPPTQERIDQQFVAQCPMVLFESSLTITAASCNEPMGQWIDPSNPLNIRTVLRWKPFDMGGVYFGVDSALTGIGSALFAEFKQLVTWTGYKFALTNCLGVERFEVQEEVFKIDSMGNVESTNEMSDIAANGNQYFLKYNVYNPVGALVSQSNLFQVGANQVNFTKVENGYATGQLIAVATRIGNWKGLGWTQCMSSHSPRAWSVWFPENQPDHSTVATVQDIRVVLAGAITLMAYRDEHRQKDGLNLQGQSRMWFVFIAGLLLVCFAGLLCVNCCLICLASGVKDKVKKTLWDTERAFLPKRPLMHHAPPLHASW